MMVIRSLLWGLIGAVCGIAIWAFCSWLDYFPETIIGQFAILFSPVELFIFSFLYNILYEYNNIKEWWVWQRNFGFTW